MRINEESMLKLHKCQMCAKEYLVHIINDNLHYIKIHEANTIHSKAWRVCSTCLKELQERIKRSTNAKD